MLPTLPSPLNQNTPSASDGRLNSSQAGAGGGFTGSIFTNIATGRSSLTSSASASQGDIPWVWILAGAAVLLLVWGGGKK